MKMPRESWAREASPRRQRLVVAPRRARKQDPAVVQINTAVLWQCHDSFEPEQRLPKEASPLCPPHNTRDDMQLLPSTNSRSGGI